MRFIDRWKALLNKPIKKDENKTEENSVTSMGIVLDPSETQAKLERELASREAASSLEAVMQAPTVNSLSFLFRSEEGLNECVVKFNPIASNELALGLVRLVEELTDGERVEVETNLVVDLKETEPLKTEYEETVMYAKNEAEVMRQAQEAPEELEPKVTTEDVDETVTGKIGGGMPFGEHTKIFKKSVEDTHKILSEETVSKVEPAKVTTFPNPELQGTPEKANEVSETVLETPSVVQPALDKLRKFDEPKVEEKELSFEEKFKLLCVDLNNPIVPLSMLGVEEVPDDYGIINVGEEKFVTTVSLEKDRTRVSALTKDLRDLVSTSGIKAYPLIVEVPYKDGSVRVLKYTVTEVQSALRMVPELKPKVFSKDNNIFIQVGAF